MGFSDSYTCPERKGYHRNIHEGEYVPLPSRPFPVGKPTSVSRSSTPPLSNSQTVLPPSRIQSPILDTCYLDVSQNESYLEEETNAAKTEIHRAVVRQGSNIHTGIPSILHKWTHTHSILSVIAAPSKDLLICGTQDSKILIFDTNNYSLKKKIDTGSSIHSSSILCLALSKDENLLFSGGSDSLVRVWDLSKVNALECDIRNTHIIYSLVDVGDIFSISWSDELSTLFIGTQSAAILWCTLFLSTPDGTVSKMPHFRYDKFFDSKGPGGSLNYLQSEQRQHLKEAQGSKDKKPKLIEISKEDTIKFAHYGYVYCMELFDCSLTSTHDFLFRYKDQYDNILISGGGDGILKIWGIKKKDSESFIISIVEVDYIDSQDSILSTCVKGSYIYAGLSNSTINVWDLNTLQLIRSFANADASDMNEILGVGIYNNCVFKASNLGGLSKISLRSTWDKSALTEEVRILDDYTTEAKIDPVLALRIFQNRHGSTLLVSGGSNSVHLWDISEVGEKRLTSAGTEYQMQFELKYDNDHLLKVLHQYVSYKTISRYPSLYIEDSRHCAQFLTKLLISLGAAHTKIIPVENGNPIVYSTFSKNIKKDDNESTTRVLWYAHYDVVDAVIDDNWQTDPFTLTPKEANLYGRGVSDNKGPTLASMFAVAELFHKKELSCDVVFVIEGEEECGSIGFQEVINKNKKLIGDIDWIMLSNSYWLDNEIPCLNYGLRGVINASITVKSDKPDRHSGVDGGVSREPAMDLVHILSKLVDAKDNKVAIPNFYDDVLPLSKQEMEFYEKIKEQDVKSLVAKWRNPSLTVHKMEFSGPNNNTVIPQSVSASISIRIVPNQELSKIKESLCKFVEQEGIKLNTDNDFSIDIFHEAEPWLGDPSNLVYKILFKNLKKNWGPGVPEPLFIREGGSIPSVRFLEKAFNAPAAQIPCGQASDNAHLNNEKLRILNLFKLRDVLTDTFRELGFRES